MTRRTCILSLFFLVTWLTPNLAQKNVATGIDNEPLNYFKIRQNKLDSWGGEIPPKGNGYGVFKRWEEFWKSRVYPDGTFPDASHNEREYNKFMAGQTANKRTMQQTANWTSLGPNSSPGGYNGVGRINCIAFHPTNSNIIWAGTPAGGLWKSTNGGSTWSTNTDNLVSVMALGVSSIAIDPSAPNIMYMATGDKDALVTQSVGIMKSTDGGVTWAPTGNIPSSRIFEVVIHPVNHAIILVAASDGIYRSTNSGGSWTKIQNGFRFTDLKFKPGSSSVVYAVSSSSFYRSTDAGVNWTLIGSVPSSYRIQIAVSPANSSFIALVSSDSDGRFNGFYTSFNSGSTFGLKYFGPINLLNGDPNGGPNGGAGQGYYDLCIAVSPSNINDIFIGAVNLWRSTNGGSNWSLANHWIDSPIGVPVVHADKHCLIWQNNNTLFQGNDGGIYKSTNGGNSWIDLSNSMVISQIYRIGVSSFDNKVIIGLQDNSTKLKNNSGAWIEIEKTGDGADNFFHPSNPNIIYCSRIEGDLRRSTNGGVTWQVIKPTGQVGDWLTPWAMDPGNPSVLIAGYKDVWKSTNQGNSWFKISNNLTSSNLTSLAIAPSNSSVIYVSTLTSIWKTTNGGGSWSNITSGLPTSGADISYITVDPVDPNKVYVTLSGLVSNNKIFRSTNGGSNWTNITGNLPNVSTNCVVVQPGANDAVYVGTDIGVYYKDPNLPQWIAFNNNLPVLIVRELECKASSGKITAGTFGRGVWESDFYSASQQSDYLTISPTSKSVAPNAGNATFDVSSNVSWTVSDNANWVTFSPASGNGNGQVQVSFTANTSPSARTATITVSGTGSLTATGTIVQSGVSSGVCNVPTGLKTSNITQTSATFRWDAVSGAGSYSFQYRTLPNGQWSNIFNANSVTYTASSYLAGTSYEWRVRSNCANGLTSDWSGLATFTTLDPPQCETPDYLNTSDITQTSVIATWDPVPGAVSYQLQTRVFPTGPWIDTDPAIITGTSIFIYGFLPNTVYEWRLRANCSNGYMSAWADGVPFVTDDITCDPPTDLLVSNLTQNTCLLSWSSVPGAVSYKIQFFNSSNGLWQDLGGPPIFNTFLSLYGLWANFDYTWRVIATCSNNLESLPSDAYTFTAGFAPDCQGGSQWPFDDLFPIASWQYVTQMWGGDYSVFNVNAGTTYTFSFCAGHGGILNFDGEIYLRLLDGTVIAHTDDDCGTAPKLVWQAGFTGQVQVLLAKYTCEAEQIDSKMAYKTGAGVIGEGADDRSSGIYETRAYELVPAKSTVQNLAATKSDEVNAISLKLFPNPTSGDFTVQFDSNSRAESYVNLSVYNQFGQVVWSGKQAVKSGSNSWEIKTGDWPTGIYLVNLVDEKGKQATSLLHFGM